MRIVLLDKLKEVLGSIGCMAGGMSRMGLW